MQIISGDLLGFRSGRSLKNTALFERHAVHGPFKAGTGLKFELIATLLQVTPQSLARLEFAWLAIRGLGIERLNDGVEPSHGEISAPPLTGVPRSSKNCKIPGLSPKATSPLSVFPTMTNDAQ
jgi:hypothetical protein